MIIRQEITADYAEVAMVIQKAFEAEEMSDHQEQFLVERIRKSEGFIPELSLVAEIDNKIVGYILTSEILLKTTKDHTVLALAPVAVLPEHQGKNIGSELIKTSHTIATSLNYGAIFLLGHDAYYPRFGYVEAKSKNIEFPFDVPSQYCMCLELKKDYLKDKKGKISYPKTFG